MATKLLSLMLLCHGPTRLGKIWHGENEQRHKVPRNFAACCANPNSPEDSRCGMQRMIKRGSEILGNDSPASIEIRPVGGL